MHIKQVIIEGFKSYKSRTVVDGFDKRHNVVVGLNGTGKSNFFCAIQFVLSDEYAHLGAAQRQSLLHESSGPRVVTGYVEIIFDNTDARIPVEGTEVCIRRVIGAKKDQYFFNKRATPRNEVMNFLESAGFSRSNPYYIVKQGKVGELSMAADSKRLKLLKEVAGVGVYDDKKRETEILLAETEEKQKNINSLLTELDEKLQNLEKERDEMKQYLKLDRMQKAISNILYEAELNESKKKLLELVSREENNKKDRMQLADHLIKIQKNVELTVKKIRQTKNKILFLKDDDDRANTKYQTLIKDRAKLDCALNDLTDEATSENKRKEIENELDQLVHSIEAKENELKVVRAQFEKMRQQEEECQILLSLKEQKINELYARQGRCNQFESRDDRDRWIQRELESLRSLLKDKEEYMKGLEDNLRQDSERIAELTENIEKHAQEIARQRNAIETFVKQRHELNKEQDKLQSEKNELWQKENSAQLQIACLREELVKTNKKLRMLVGRATFDGCESIEKVLNTFNSRGGEKADIARLYYGQVVDNFNCKEELFTAVEVSVGNTLFNHVVDSAKIGSMILKEMNIQKLPGEVTFMPLNKLMVKNIQYKPFEDATPLLRQIEYEEKLDKVHRYLFGETLLVRNMKVGTQLARELKVNCVTIDGEKVSKKGPLSGGYINTNKSRIKTAKQRNEIMCKIEQSKKDLDVIVNELAKTDTLINQNIDKLQRNSIEHNKAIALYDNVKINLKLTRENLSYIERNRDPKVQALTRCKISLDYLKTKIDCLESELGGDMSSQLSDQDKANIYKWNTEVQVLLKEIKHASSTRIEIDAEKSKLENMLTNNLIRRRDQLLQTLEEIQNDNQMRIRHKSEIDAIDNKIDKVKNDVTTTKMKLNETRQLLNKEEQELDVLRITERDNQEKLDKCMKLQEEIKTKQIVLNETITNYASKINNLGTLPSAEVYAQYVKMTSQQLLHELEKLNKQLKNYSHVNRKAVDQFTNFSHQRDIQQKEKQEMDKCSRRIKDLIELLDLRKLQALQFTIKQVSKYFGDIFKKMIPEGTARLVLKTKFNQEGHNIGPDDTNVDQFTGIGVRITFKETEEQMKEMNQLSGGQKTLVALAMIFAIQKCDPAPFYLFDEVDQALDSQYRTAVGQLIYELSNDTQFITTTFRPEFLEYAHKFYGVSSRNKISQISIVTKDNAKNFVHSDKKSS